MTESARPESIVPAPPQVFRQWVKRQAMIAVGITVCVIGFFVVRMLMRERNPMLDFDGWRVWVAGSIAPGSYGQATAVALEPGGPELDVRGNVTPQMVYWVPNGAKQPTWQHVTLMANDSRKLVRVQTRSIATFALLGETRTIDGVVWQEAWRVGDGTWGRPRGGSASKSGAVWRLEGVSETPALLRLEDDGDVRALDDSASAPADQWAGAWESADGVIRIVESAVENSARSQRRWTGYPVFVIGRLAPDGRTFTGFETSGAAVTGTRVE